METCIPYSWHCSPDPHSASANNYRYNLLTKPYSILVYTSVHFGCFMSYKATSNVQATRSALQKKCWKFCAVSVTYRDFWCYFSYGFSIIDTLPCRKKSVGSNFRLILYTASISNNSQNQIYAGLISCAAMTARHVPRVTPMQTMQCVLCVP